MSASKIQYLPVVSLYTSDQVLVAPVCGNNYSSAPKKAVKKRTAVEQTWTETIENLRWKCTQYVKASICCIGYTVPLVYAGSLGSKAFVKEGKSQGGSCVLTSEVMKVEFSCEDYHTEYITN